MVSKFNKRSKASRLIGMFLVIIMLGCFAVPDKVDAAGNLPPATFTWTPIFDKSEFVYDGTEQSVKITNSEKVYTALEAEFNKGDYDTYDPSKVKFKIIVNGADPDDYANEIDITDTMKISIGTEVGDFVTIDFIRVYYVEEAHPQGGIKPYDGRIEKTFTIKPKEETRKVTFMANKGKIKKDGKYTANKLTLVKTYGEKYGTLPKAKKTGYKFKGWYTKKKGGTKITQNTVMKSSKDFKLYARWVKNGKIAKCKSAWIRSGSGISYKTKGYVKKNQKICIIKSVKSKNKNLWYKVKVGNKTGYIYSKYVKRV